MRKKIIDIEQNKFTLNMVSHWIDSADTKIEIAFAFFSACFSAMQLIISKMFTAYTVESCFIKYTVCTLPIISIMLFSIGFLFFISALKPRFSSSKDINKYSIFYEKIASFNSEKEFAVCNKNATESEFEDEVRLEIYYLSRICSKKMHKFKIGLIISTVAILVEIIVFLLFAVYMYR